MLEEKPGSASSLQSFDILSALHRGGLLPTRESLELESCPSGRHASQHGMTKNSTQSGSEPLIWMNRVVVSVRSNLQRFV